ncbi:6-phospho-3-hexuloisomerase [Leeuwenhoekiella aequorea]|uniref:3-hexulose-6-phosphate isomerase n=1 Tax=Leeuwenhoekiella aequorea TaxID=283736 RepID=A0A4V1KQT7_9FLAO|nr:6-phospho-3-hexuloisomerase [Leeuwenhoekiella aequorea]RXG22552.1 3-hexulose-6-phosphate isomerase [Leeuwenhoekiella aequorea]
MSAQQININKKSEEAMNSILNEHKQLLEQFDFQQLSALVDPIQEAKVIFLIGMGRSGLMMKAAAMRLMHLGFTAYVVGETTTPAIGSGDLLIAGSGSGTTSTVIRAAKTAKDQNAKVACFTTDAASELAALSDYIVNIPAAQKQAHENTVSDQYAGSLFEQALLLFFDALIQTLWSIDGSSAEELYKRHSNLE